MTTVLEREQRPLTSTKANRSRRLGELSFQGLLLGCTGVGLIVLGILLYTVFNKGGSRLSVDFLTSFPSRRPASAGVKAAIYGSVWLIGLTTLIAVPISVGAAIYLEEMAPRNRFTRLIEVNISNLAGVPSIIYGILALGVVARGLGLGFSLWTGSIALSLLAFPVIVIAARESIRAVPPSIRQGAYALGATRWQVTKRAVIPPARGGILTGCILALSRALGEAAPLLLLGALVFSASVPNDPSDRYTALPLQIFNWINRPQPGFQITAAAGIIVLLGVLFTINGVAIALRRRGPQTW
ncbi:MAG TPA: phosphate ABC transporter permease PstA [Mycobacteriales bacterium]|nr:phosphate ABC transporter permease PstA [Mycobacteriales bacterium]